MSGSFSGALVAMQEFSTANHCVKEKQIIVQLQLFDLEI